MPKNVNQPLIKITFLNTVTQLKAKAKSNILPLQKNSKNKRNSPKGNPIRTGFLPIFAFMIKSEVLNLLVRDLVLVASLKLGQVSLDCSYLGPLASFNNNVK